MLITMNPYLKLLARNLHLSAFRIAIIAPLLLIAASVACGGESADDDGIMVEVVVEGLTSPRGLAYDQDGILLIAETGGGRVLKVTADGGVQSLTTTRLPHSLSTGPGGAYRAGPSAISLLNGELFFIVGEFLGNQSARLYRITDEPGYEPVTPATDAFSPTTNRFSNPYDIVNAPEVDGWIVSDAGGNSLLAVDLDGNIRDYVVFQSFTAPDHPVPVEMVPTGIARGPDGAVYVGSLTGFPYPREQAVVWRVEDLNGDGDAMDEGEVEPFVTGLTAVTDITFGADGTLYIAEFSSDTGAVLEGGDFSENAAANPGRVLRWNGSELTVFAGNVVSPTGLLATESTLYISEEYAGRVSEGPIN
ncbi:MAG: ScyD/ScyE family protein [Chloroflexi bacterium]|nr:ScyD/ScyE family protein [Chloroflexota bacterium]